MNPANYVACRARLSQGDLVRSPVGVFVQVDDLADPASIDVAGSPLTGGDPAGVSFVIPRLVVGGAPVIGRAWYQPAIVVSPDCAIEKSPKQVLVAPVQPLSILPENTQNAIRAGAYVNAVDLPADEALLFQDSSRAPFPHSYVELERIVPVSHRLLLGQRMVGLSEAQIDRMRAAWLRFIAPRELSTTGSIVAVKGKRVDDVKTVESTGNRHIVMLTFDDASSIVVYQEPRRRGPYTQSVHVFGGTFSPEKLTVLPETDLLLRFENDDTRAWAISSSHPDIVNSVDLPSGSTTDVLIRCPEAPCDIVLAIATRPTSQFHIWVGTT